MSCILFKKFINVSQGQGLKMQKGLVILLVLCQDYCYVIEQES